MGRMYAVTFSNVAVTAAQDFFSLKAADDIPVLLHAVYLGQQSDVGDASEEMLVVHITRGAATIGSGGSNPARTPLDSNDAASSITTNCRANDTTEVSGGTALILHAEHFNIRTGFMYVPTPECRIRSDEGDGFLAVALIVAPDDSLTMCGTLIFEEI